MGVEMTKCTTKLADQPFEMYESIKCVSSRGTMRLADQKWSKQRLKERKIENF